MTARFSYPIMTLFVALAALPLATASPYHLTVAGLALIFAILAQGTNLIMGTAGQASFAHAAFFGLGAYTTAVLSTKFDFPVWLTLPIALCLSFVVGSLLAYPALRVRGFYLALVTFAFSEIFTSVVGEMPGVLGGTEGISGIPPFTLGGWSADDRMSKYYVVWVGAVLAYLSLARLNSSHFGRVARSLRELGDRRHCGRHQSDHREGPESSQSLRSIWVLLDFSTHISCNTSALRASASTSQFLWCPWSSSVDSAIRPAFWWERWY